MMVKILQTPSPVIKTPEQIEISREARRTETLRMMKKGKTNVGRWTRSGECTADYRWFDRAMAAGKLIPENIGRVLDLGCGDMKMEQCLPPGCSYIPLDVSKRDDRTIVVDLNRKVPKIEADFVVGMGVLEYLLDVPNVLRKIARQIPEGLFSYHPFEKSPKRDRLAMGWVNALSSKELIALLHYAGYKSVDVVEYAATLHFYRVSKTRSPTA
ncbi:methyltransferase domain-containing protein [Sphingobium sp. CAP-1]|uniref:methyltransferase domain-containing protein n=1 Tax=Sphingobium sp. CAP-1 TaxID=2676077 RepID=UPI0012BB2CA7|nr:methyltransferase domain-containing protein [Sphingobium sp. CAP-1]QGP78287.1 methyltransferase domain-containing protein [Sphingobium sp. CAP-1]